MAYAFFPCYEVKVHGYRNKILERKEWHEQRPGHPLTTCQEFFSYEKWNLLVSQNAPAHKNTKNEESMMVCFIFCNGRGNKMEDRRAKIILALH
jgi:hypothetical protein